MKKTLSLVTLIIALVINVQIASAVTYYSKVSQNVPTALSNWTTATNGTGSNPANFTTAGDVFIIQATHSYISTSAWAITGALTINGTFNPSGQALTVTGNTTVAVGGTFTDDNDAGVNTFTGLFTNSGTINTSIVTTIGNVVFNGGITNTAGTFNVPSCTINTTGNRTITATTAINWSANNISITNAGTLTIAGAGGVTISGTSPEAILGALAVTGNLTFSTTGAVSVAGSTVVSGAGNLTDNENTSTTTFTGLVTLTAGTIDLSALSTANVLINGGLTYTAGTLNIPKLTFNTTSNRTLTATSAVSWSTDNIAFAGTGTFTVAGAGGLTLTGTANIAIPGTLTINAASLLTLNSSGSTTLSSTSSISGNLNVNGKNLIALGNITVNNGGTLDIGAGGFLRMANTRTITNAGTFRAVGTLGNVATITNNGSGNFTIIQSAATGVFHANNYLVDNLGIAGIVISNGSIDATNNFSNGSFTNGLGGASSTYLNLTSANLGAGITVSGTSFGAGQLYNVTRTTGTGTVTFQDAQGALGTGTAGQQYEKDNGIPGSLINWNTSGAAYYSQASGNVSSLSNWNTATDGSGSSPVASKLTDASSTFIIQANHTITVDQNIQVASLQLSNNTTLVIGNDATSRTVIVEGDFTVPTTATVIAGSVAATHTFTAKGSFVNNGTVNFLPTSSRIVNLTLEGNAKTFTPNATTTLNNITFNTGSYSAVSYTLGQLYL